MQQFQTRCSVIQVTAAMGCCIFIYACTAPTHVIQNNQIVKKLKVIFKKFSSQKFCAAWHSIQWLVTVACVTTWHSTAPWHSVKV